MTTMWLVCLSLLVAADAASLGPRAVDIPVEVVYQETPVKLDHGKHANEASANSHGHAVSLKNLHEKSQLSAEEVVEAAVLNIPAGIIKISDEVSVAKAPLDLTSSSEESREIPDESNAQESNEINNELVKQPIVLDIPIAPVNVEPIILKEGEQEQIVEQLAIAEDAPIAAAPTIVEVVEQLVEEVPLTPVVNEEPTLLEVVGQDIVAVDNDVAKGKSVPESVPDGVLIVEFPNDEPQSVQEEQKIEPQLVQEAQKLEPEVAQEVQNLPPLAIEQEIVTPEKDVAKGKSVPVVTPEVVLDEKVEPELVAEVQNTEPQVVPEVQNIEPSVVSETLEEVKDTPALDNVPIVEVKPEELPLEADPVLKVQLREANPEPAVQAAAPANQIVEEAPPASPKPTTQKPASGPLVGIQNAINRLGETVGLRPTNAPLKADAEPVAATGTPPTLTGGFQQNINNQLTNFGNQVNGFIDNLRPKPPVAAGVESDEAVTPAPNTPFLNFIQTQFNNGLTGFASTINNTLNNQQSVTQSDEAAPAPAAGPVQQIFNSAAQFQNNIAGMINNWNQQQQSDEQSPAPGNTNIGQQIFGFFSNGLAGITQNLNRPQTAGNVQGDEVVTTAPGSGPFSGISTAINNFNTQWNPWQSGNQPLAIATQIPQGSNPLTQLPGVSQLQGQIPSASQLPGVSQLQGQIPDASQLPGVSQLQGQIPSVSQLQGQIPGASQLQQGAQQIATLIPGADQLPGASLLTPTPVLPASQILTTTSQN